MAQRRVPSPIFYNLLSLKHFKNIVNERLEISCNYWIETWKFEYLLSESE